jgi:hypothetical protein
MFKFDFLFAFLFLASTPQDPLLNIPRYNCGINVIISTLISQGKEIRGNLIDTLQSDYGNEYSLHEIKGILESCGLHVLGVKYDKFIEIKKITSGKDCIFINHLIDPNHYTTTIFKGEKYYYEYDYPEKDKVKWDEFCPEVDKRRSGYGLLVFNNRDAYENANNLLRQQVKIDIESALLKKRVAKSKGDAVQPVSSPELTIPKVVLSKKYDDNLKMFLYGIIKIPEKNICIDVKGECGCYLGHAVLNNNREIMVKFDPATYNFKTGTRLAVTYDGAVKKAQIYQTDVLDGALVSIVPNSIYCSFGVKKILEVRAVNYNGDISFKSDNPQDGVFKVRYNELLKPNDRYTRILKVELEFLKHPNRFPYYIYICEGDGTVLNRLTVYM